MKRAFLVRSTGKIGAINESELPDAATHLRDIAIAMMSDVAIYEASNPDVPVLLIGRDGKVTVDSARKSTLDPALQKIVASPAPKSIAEQIFESDYGGTSDEFRAATSQGGSAEV